MPDAPLLPTAFSFHLSLGEDSASFQEVSGISARMETESIEEGGENRFVHRLPKTTKQETLRLKRGTVESGGELLMWCKATLEGGLGAPIATKTLTLELLDEQQKPLRTWLVHEAWPVKWEVVGFDSGDKSRVVIETLELSCKSVERK